MGDEVQTQDEAQPRVFVVGCPRTGTTLVQRLLGAHTRVAALPDESRFFVFVVPERQRWRWLRRLGLASRQTKFAFEWLSEVMARDSEDDAPFVRRPRFSPFTRRHARAFVSAMDEWAARRGASIWVEKSPDHLLRIAEIEQHVPGARFIHVVRSGIDTVASLYEVTHANTDDWWGHAWSIDECIDRWNDSIVETAVQLGNPAHLLLRYEDLVERPEDELRRVCSFIGIEFEEQMLTAERGNSRDVVYHQNLGKPIQNFNDSRSRRIFSATQRAEIESRLLDVDWDLLRSDPSRAVGPAR